MWKYLDLLSSLKPFEIQSIKKSVVDDNTNPRDVKLKLSEELVTRFYGEKTGKSCIENFVSRFSNKEITDDRLMPSYFLIKDIEQNMIDRKNFNIFFLSIISMNSKNWIELHPEHLSFILEAFRIYDDGSLIKPIILEILNDLKIIL